MTKIGRRWSFPCGLGEGGGRGPGRKPTALAPGRASRWRGPYIRSVILCTSPCGRCGGSRVCAKQAVFTEMRRGIARASARAVPRRFDFSVQERPRASLGRSRGQGRPFGRRGRPCHSPGPRRQPRARQAGAGLGRSLPCARLAHAARSASRARLRAHELAKAPGPRARRFDPCSSASWFDGWESPPRRMQPPGSDAEDCRPVVEPAT